LADVDLPALTTVGRDLRIYNNVMLTAIDGFAALTSVGGNLIIHSNSLQTLNGFNATGTVGALYVNSEPDLASLAGFGALTTANGPVHLQDLTTLSSLTGLTNLATIQGDLLIDDTLVSEIDNFNPTLDGALTTLGGDLYLYRNSLLTTCAGNDLAAQLTANGWTGSLFTQNNLACTGSCVGAVCN
jgi:hypothetical protein